MKHLSEIEIALLKTILKDARKSIKDGQDFFVCVALEMLAYKHGQRATKYLRTWVTQMLQGHGTLEGWLVHNRGIESLYSDTSKYRVQWLTWMIKELDKELVGRQGSPA